MYTIERQQDFVIYRDEVENVTLSISAADYAGMLQTKPIPPITEDEVFRQAVLQPQSGLPLSQIARAKQAKTACVLVSDSTRAVPTSRVAAIVVDELLAGGVPLSGILFIVAIGVHRQAGQNEMRSFLGEELYGKVRIENHTPFEADNLIKLGTTSRGTPVEVNKRAYDCDLHIQIGKVEPHEFAGFSGGRKSVLPGIASEEAIITNHRPEMISDAMAAIGVLEGNPVNEDMLEAAELFRIDFAINFILNNELEPAALFAGGMKESHYAAVNFVRKYLGVIIEKPDIIVTTPGQPLNIDFYQTVKALIALTEIVDQSVTIVLYSECAEGISSPDMLRAFQSSGQIDEVVQYATENYRIQMDHVLLLAKIFRKKVKIVVYSPNIEPDDLKDMFFIPCTDVEQLMETAYSVCGKERPKVLFYPRPQTGLPILSEA